MNEEKNAENVENAEINQIGIRFNKESYLIEMGIISPEKTINLKLNLQAVVDLNKGFCGVIQEATEFLNQKTMEESKETELEEIKETELEKSEVIEEIKDNFIKLKFNTIN